MRLIILALFTFLFTGLTPQKDTTLKKTPADTGLLADSVTVIAPKPDSISAFIRMPDSTRHNQFIDTLIKRYGFDPFIFAKQGLKHHQQLRTGTERPSHSTWIIAVILFLLVYTGILNRVMGKDIVNIIFAFYTKASFVKLSREDSLLNSWAFICLFSLFGLTLGLYAYQVLLYKNTSNTLSGFQLFISCSVFVVALFILKILVLRILGFIFDIRNIINEYVAILYLTYFNVAFIFLPVVICFSLFPVTFLPGLFSISIAILIIIALIQFARSVLNIISNFSFSKIYLFIYLCALEICPVLILIKALDL